MLGPGSDWVKNVEAAHGDAVIRHGRRRPVHLVAMPPEQRAPILREYVRIASSGRQHFPLPVGAPLSDFEAIAGRYPVYRIDLAVGQLLACPLPADDPSPDPAGRSRSGFRTDARAP